MEVGLHRMIRGVMLTALAMVKSWARSGGVGVGGVSAGTVDIPAETDDAGAQRVASRTRFRGGSGVEWER